MYSTWSGTAAREQVTSSGSGVPSARRPSNSVGVGNRSFVHGAVAGRTAGRNRSIVAPRAAPAEHPRACSAAGLSRVIRDRSFMLMIGSRAEFNTARSNASDPASRSLVRSWSSTRRTASGR
jgi:hypothetical protein